jgi:hypothetical protein
MFHQNNRTGQKSLSCNGHKIYNKLPQHIKQEKALRMKLLSGQKIKNNIQ